jgi:hypothetical protein
MNESDRRRWINFGEIIAVAALIVSALGVWIAWKSSSNNQPTRVVEQRQPIPLTLRGKAQSDGRTLEIAPVEASHALQSLAITPIGSTSAINVGSDGDLDAGDIEHVLGSNVKRDDGKHSLRVRIQAEYVEAGTTRHATGTYALTYRWQGGGLFGGKSLSLVGLSRCSLADDLFGLEEEVDLDRGILVAVRTVDRIGLDRFGVALADRALGSVGGVGRAHHVAIALHGVLALEHLNHHRT